MLHENYVRLFEPFEQNIKRDNEKALNGYRIFAREEGEGTKKNPCRLLRLRENNVGFLNTRRSKFTGSIEKTALGD